MYFQEQISRLCQILCRGIWEGKGNSSYYLIHALIIFVHHVPASWSRIGMRRADKDPSAPFADQFWGTTYLPSQDSLVQPDCTNASFSVWVPTSTYIHANFNQSMIDALTSRNFIKASYYSFLMSTSHSDVEKVLAPTWPQYYEDRKNNLTCTACALPISFAQAFATKCGHFYCTICSAYSTFKPKKTFTFKLTVEKDCKIQ